LENDKINVIFSSDSLKKRRNFFKLDCGAVTFTLEWKVSAESRTTILIVVLGFYLFLLYRFLEWRFFNLRDS